MIDLGEIEEAVERLRPVIYPTPTARSAELTELYGRSVLLKPEHLQRAGSFKIRGAFNCISCRAAEGATEFVAASAGNHAQGVALAASLVGARSTIYMPTGVSLPKLEATRAYGARTELVGANLAEALAAARVYAEAAGACFVPPFDDDLVIAGQATIGYELADEAPDAEVVVVPVGGGGLLAGIAAGLRARGSRARVVGVEAVGAASMRAALDAGRPVTLAVVDTLADGIAVSSVSDRTLQYAKSYVDELVAVDDELTSSAMLTLVERCKWVVEPAGAVGLAALAAGEIGGSGPVVVVLSGGNIDPLLLSRLIEHGMSAAGRYVIARVAIPDRPGSLALLTDLLGRLGMNLLSVEHQRFGTRVRLNEVEVTVTMETRDPAHRDEIVPALATAGFSAELLS